MGESRLNGLLALAALAAFAGPAAVALCRRPQRGVLVLCALIPFDGLLLLVDWLPPLAAGWKEGLVLATLGATLVASPEARGGGGTGGRAPLPGWAPAVGGLMLLGVASAMVVGGLQAVWGLKIAFFFVLVVVILRRCPLSAGERDALVTILMVTGTVTAGYGIAQQVIGADGLNALGYEYNSAIRFAGDYLRSFSSFDNPFGFGYFLMLVLLVGVTYAMAEPQRMRSRLFWLCTPVMVLGLATSVVRGAWIGLAVGLGYLAWTRYRVLLLGLPVALVVLLLLPTGVSSAAFSSRSGGQRVQAWDANLAAIATHPLGVGLGSSNAAAEKVAGGDDSSENPSGDEVFHPDNEYYRALYELGVLGAWLTVLLLVSSFLTARATAPTDLLGLAVSSTVLAAAAASAVTTYLDTFPNNVYFWVLLGTLAAPPSVLVPPAPSKPVTASAHA